MVPSVTNDGDADAQEVLLDPFSFHLGLASKISGLGGSDQGHDATYAFHSPYVEAEPGPAHFRIRFKGLTALHGTLQLWVNMLPLEPGARARVANSERIQLNRIVQQGGEAQIRFEGFRGVSFALHGTIPGETDARAQSLEIVLDRPLATLEATSGVEARSSAFGRDAVLPTAALLSKERAKFALPVSQMCTAPQLREPAFAKWVKTLGIGNLDRLAQWRGAYMMQALDCYGMLADGARVLALGVSGSELPDALAARGLSVVVAAQEHAAQSAIDGEPADQPGSEGASRRGRGDGPVRYRSVRFDALPPDLVNFDVVLSDGVAGQLGCVKNGVDFLISSIGCLRPGGLAIHIVPFDPWWSHRVEDAAERLRFLRRDIERTALILISRNYEVAQIKIDASGLPDLRRDAEEDMISFGLIARRPPTVY